MPPRSMRLLARAAAAALLAMMIALPPRPALAEAADPAPPDSAEVPSAGTNTSQTAGNGAAAVAPRDTGSFLLELNKMEDIDGFCRAYFIVRNGLSEAVSVLELDAYLIGTDGVISQRIALFFDAIEAGKTRVFPFDFAPECGSYGEVLIDRILSCEGPGACATVLTTSSRAIQPLTY